MIYSRYNVEFLELPLETAVIAIRESMKQDIENKAFLRWIIRAQFEMGFEEFMHNFERSEKSDEEIIADTEAILRNFLN